MHRHANSLLRISFVVLWALGCGGVPCSSDGALAAAEGGVYLNEVMASNGSVIMDPQGQFDDWIELYNTSRTPIDIGGMYLTDNPGAPTQWRIPTDRPNVTTMPSGGLLLVWADGDTAAAIGLHASFKLDAGGDAVYLFAADGRTLLDSVQFGPQTPDVSYGRYPDGTGDWGFLLAPTPGAANIPSYAGAVSDPTFSREHGLCEEPFEIVLSCGTPEAVIYYTVDGSEPYQQGGRAPTGTVYTQPIRITRTTCLRAVAVRPGWVSSRVQTQTYLFPGDVVQQSARPPGFPTSWGGVAADYEMDPTLLSDPRYAGQLLPALRSLPSMSLVMDTRDLFDTQTGIYANPQSAGDNWERPGSIELIFPDGTEGFQINCGVQIQGGYFRSAGATTKHSFRLVFKGAYGPTRLRYPLFAADAVQEFETITLRAGANDGYSWSGNEQNATFLRDQFVHDLQRATGHASPHGTFVHLYVNGLYWGLYNPCERPDAAFSSSYHGGNPEDWDVFKHKNFSLDQGNRTALNLLIAECREAAQSYEVLQRLQGRGLDGALRPDLPCLLDSADYVDYMIVNMWAGNWDWPWNNYWLARDRSEGSTGFKFYCWDAEDVMLTSRSPLAMDKITNPDSRDVGQFHTLLRDNPEYRLFFADRVHRLFFNDGVLTPGPLIQRFAQLAARVEKAVLPEAARWGDLHGRNITPANWATMRDKILGTYLPQRSALVLNQFRTAGLYPALAAPVFQVDGTDQYGGHVATGVQLAMTGDTVWYTLDGRDPRRPNQTAQAGSSTTLVPENAPKRVLVPTGPIDATWRGGGPFADSTWTAVTGSPGGVGYERGSGYEQFLSIDLGQQMYNQQTTCYVRIPFTLDQDPTQLDVVQLRVRYDDGFVAYLNGTEVARRNFTGEPVWNSAASAQNDDTAAASFEDINLAEAHNYLRTGVNTLAIQLLNNSKTSSDLLLCVVLAADRNAADGASVSPTASQYLGPIALTQSVQVKARALSGTTWSALNEAVFVVGPVAEGLRVSEIMYHPFDTGNPDDPNTEYIELTNIAGQSINLNMVRFTRGIDFIFPGFELPAGGYCLVVRDLAAFEAKYGPNLPVVGEYAGNLSNGGEEIELVDAAGAVIQRFTYRDNWFKTTDGQGLSLAVKNPTTADGSSLNDPGAWRAANPSPGRINP